MSDLLLDTRGNVRLSLPEGWEAATRRASTALFASYGGRGAVNVSVLRSKPGVPIDVKGILTRLVRGAGPVAEREPRALPAGETVFEIGYEEGARAWRARGVRRANTVVLLTYNCKLEAKGAEDAAVAEIVDSVRIKPRPDRADDPVILPPGKRRYPALAS